MTYRIEQTYGTRDVPHRYASRTAKVRVAYRCNAVRLMPQGLQKRLEVQIELTTPIDYVGILPPPSKVSPRQSWFFAQAQRTNLNSVVERGRMSA